MDVEEFDWRTLAACRPPAGASDEVRRSYVAVFFPDDGDYREAEQFCRVCVVKAECATYADATRPSHGWWAGQQRDRLGNSVVLRRRLGCSRCGGPVGASGLRRPGGRWCSLRCFDADREGLPLLHTDARGEPSPQARPL